MESTITVKGQATITEGHSRSISPVKTGIGQVLRTSRWQRGSVAKAFCFGIARHDQVPTPTAGDHGEMTAAAAEGAAGATRRAARR